LVAVFVSGCWGYSLGLLRFFGPETFKQHQKIVNTAYLTIFGYYEIEKKLQGQQQHQQQQHRSRRRRRRRREEGEEEEAEAQAEKCDKT
jgi:hypothetical protein